MEANKVLRLAAEYGLTSDSVQHLVFSHCQEMDQILEFRGTGKKQPHSHAKPVPDMCLTMMMMSKSKLQFRTLEIEAFIAIT